MGMNIPFYRMPPERFPVLIEALDWQTREVLWTHTVERPNDTTLVKIPPLARIHKTLVAIRITFGDGETLTTEPPTPTLSSVS